MLRSQPDRKVSIAFLGWFGAGNLGNECTLQAMIHHCRSAWPEAVLRCICVVPEDVEARHGIAAIPINEIPLHPAVGTPRPRSRSMAKRVVGKLKTLVGRLPVELAGWTRAFRTLMSTDMLIVPGTGLLTDAYASPFGWPYIIFRWSWAAKLCRCRLLFVSVGAGPIYHPLSRWFFRSALAVAGFRSYRDCASQEYLNSIGISGSGDRVYPDLAFSLPDQVMPVGEKLLRQAPVVGLGMMHYAGRLSVANPAEATYRTYLKELAEFANWLLVHQYDISLLIGDASDDPHVVDDFKELLRQYQSYDPSRIIDAPIQTVSGLLARLAETDAIVATRFHNALLALVLHRPVIGISFHQKCVSLMDRMGLSEYCESIDHFSAESLIRTFCRLKQNSESVDVLTRRKVAEQGEALEEQYGIIFGKPARAPRQRGYRACVTSGASPK